VSISGCWLSSESRIWLIWAMYHEPGWVWKRLCSPSATDVQPSHVCHHFFTEPCTLRKFTLYYFHRISFSTVINLHREMANFTRGWAIFGWQNLTRIFSLLLLLVTVVVKIRGLKAGVEDERNAGTATALEVPWTAIERRTGRRWNKKVLSRTGRCAFQGRWETRVLGCLPVRCFLRWLV